MTGCATDKTEEKRYGPWTFPNKQPDEKTTKKMLREALKIAIKFIMRNHIYKCDDAIKKQTKGGPIGLELTGELASIFMTWWDKELLRKLEEIGVEVLMYKRYIDDINVIFVAPDSNQEFIINEEGQGELVRNEARTKGKEENGMEILQKVGNTIHSSIKVKTDYPSAHSDNKLPLLDIKMWNENKTDTDGNMRTVILHEFYAKDVASKSVIHAASAMPPNTRRTVLTQEVLRILLRCSPLLPLGMYSQPYQHIHAKDAIL